MNKYIFCILLFLFPAAIFSQEYIQVNTQYNKANKHHELTIEIVNKSESEIRISNIRFGGTEYFSYFELCFYDKDEQQLPVSYYYPTYGVPFMNDLDGPKWFLHIKPRVSLTFNYSCESLIRNFCKKPDRIKKMKLKFHIEYSVYKQDKLVKQDVYEQFSDTISF